ncbi:3-oxo-tetronate 4-phosphate decarboxylase [Gluconobacter kondonii]|uniref:3-oxo-tetronate 4-phosphate decarboxylase n=3 Tax=Gluconobacter kondonii TaxID=941463 RepID=A0ABQ5WVG0_9PROT|nr:3-oxo-tetronate 4-phosphate decarboxylase [Gluconobacter kondonii]MBS1054609.1 aldolase [Gluconobacter kondonii]MBS1057853.1 aldolase [Gluconobacter kondonii]GLQ66607.1 class II aldolase [Gluconobacter kondonii]
MNENKARDHLARLSRSLFERGYSVGSAGNISLRLDDGYLITPTNSCLGFLEPDRISKLDFEGKHVSGDKPSKEIFLHTAFYDTRANVGAVVHLHSTYATLMSCMKDIDPEDCIRPLTPYVVMRVGKVARVPYFRPGDERGGDLIRALGGKFAAVLLANHGPVVSGKDIISTVYAAEELEETAKLLVSLGNTPVNYLTDDEVADLHRVFG